MKEEREIFLPLYSMAESYATKYKKNQMGLNQTQHLEQS